MYNGELYPHSKFSSEIQKLKSNRNKAFDGYCVFLEKLPEELKHEFDKLMDSHLGLLPLELEQSFMDGFCIGTRMMIEILCHENN